MTADLRYCRLQKGFTLVEVMVALTMFTLIMVATVSAFRTLSRTQLSVDAVTTRNDELRAVSTFLRDAFESAVLSANRGRTTAGGLPTKRNVFEVADDSIVWQTVLRFGESAGGSYIVRVAREGSELVLRWQQMNFYGALEPWSSVPSRVLVDDLQLFSVAWRLDFGSPWVSGEPFSRSPQWIRISLRANDRFWPDLVMQVAG